MPLVIKNEQPPNTVSVLDMGDGQIGVIVHSPARSNVGRIVQRHNDTLIAIGKPPSWSWEGLMARNGMQGTRVRILEEGETLVVEGNQ